MCTACARDAHTFAQDFALLETAGKELASQMQSELKPGEWYCMPDFPKVICREYAGGLVWVGLRGSFVERDSVKRRKGESDGRRCDCSG